MYVTYVHVCVSVQNGKCFSGKINALITGLKFRLVPFLYARCQRLSARRKRLLNLVATST